MFYQKQVKPDVLKRKYKRFLFKNYSGCFCRDYNGGKLIYGYDVNISDYFLV